MREPLDLFISYASDDESLREELEEQLSVLNRQGEVRPWHRREIAAGEEWRGQVDEQLEAADLVLLLISPSFLASDYCYDDEANRALGRHARGEARVVPVIIRPCDWQHSRFAQLEALPKGGEPVTARGNRDQAWLDVVQGLRASIAALRRARGEAPERDDGRQPRYPDEESQQLSRQLKTLFSRRKALTLTGGDTVAVDAEILDVRRLLRKGPQLRPGEFLGDGRYELIEVVGQGGFATVWKAWDGDEEKAVALKVLHGHYSEDRGKRERFFRGARKMAELAHPNIVRVFKVKCADDGWHFFVMEYLPGGNFERAVLAGELTHNRRLQVLLQAGEALEFAHQRGAVHRDVKPSNILLSESGEAKLSDFDLVRAADTTGLTATRAMLGTVQFAAPEALESAGGAGPAADVYSLASTVVFALAGGRLPAWYYRDPARAIGELDCGEAVQGVLARATSFEVAERHASVADFCQQLGASEMLGAPASGLHRAAEPPVAVSNASLELPDGTEIAAPPGTETVKPRWFLFTAVLIMLGMFAWLGPIKTESQPPSSDGETESAASVPPAESSALGFVVTVKEDGQIWLRAAEDEDADAVEASADIELMPPSAKPPVTETAGSSGASGLKNSEVRDSPPSQSPSLRQTPPVKEESRLPATVEGLEAAERRPKAGDPWVGPLGMQFRYAPPGKFRMGSPETEVGHEDDEVLHEVELTRGFWIGETEVTQGQWRQLMQSDPSYFKNCGDDCPVERVSWYEAVRFANRLSERAKLTSCYAVEDCQGVLGGGCKKYETLCGDVYSCATAKLKDPECDGFRLPTEAEWEYAARAGEQGPIYTGPLNIKGNRNAPELGKIAWYGGNSGVDYPSWYNCSVWDETESPIETCGTQTVGLKPPNEWQLRDTLGNVWEWADDWHGAYTAGAVEDPMGPDRGSNRVLRGGSWSSYARHCRSAYRGRYAPGDRLAFVGFRLVRTAD